MLTLVASILLGVNPPPTVGQTTVYTKFSFGDARVFEILPPEDRVRVEQRIASITAETADSLYPFLDWRPLPEEEGEASLKILLLRLDQERRDFGGNQPLYQISLVYPLLNYSQDLYPIGTPFDPRDTTKLIADIAEIVEKNFGDQSFRESILEPRFIRTVSLAGEIIPAEGLGIVVPVPWDGLFTGPNSKLWVDFRATDPRDDVEKGGDVFLRNPKETMAPQWPGFTDWRLESFEYGGDDSCHSLQCMNPRWRDLSPTLIEVFMLKYDFLRTNAGNIESLPSRNIDSL